MFGLGFSEILFLSVLALIVIGPKQLPEVARMIGRFINEMKRNIDEFSGDLKKQAKVDLKPTSLAQTKTETDQASLDQIKKNSENAN